MDYIIYGIVGFVVIAVFYIFSNFRSKREDDLNKRSLELLESVQKTQQAQAAQLSNLSRNFVEVSEKMTSMQVNLQDTIDARLKLQSEEFKKDLWKVNNKVDTILGLVMECDNESCPTKKKVSEYLKNQYKGK